MWWSLREWRRLCLSIIRIILILILSTKVYSQEYREVGTSIRALGMGNAFTAIVNDKDSLFYNPAGLNKVEGIYLTLFDLGLGINGLDKQDLLNNVDSSDIAATITALAGEQIWLNYKGKAAFTMGNFAAAYFYDGFLSTLVENPTFPTVNISYFNDIGYAAGFGFGVTPMISMGVVTKVINRTGGTVPIGMDVLDSLDSATIESEVNKTGKGYALDYGLNFNLPAANYISFVYKNIGNTAYQATGSGDNPPSDDSEMIIGWGMDIDLPGLNIRPAIDYKHINDSSTPLGKKLHFGLELDLPLLTVRGGINQGYYTWGFSASLGPLEIDFANYAVELGVYPGQNEDRRLILSMKVEFGFDMDFNFVDYGSVNRQRLKQRR